MNQKPVGSFQQKKKTTGKFQPAQTRQEKIKPVGKYTVRNAGTPAPNEKDPGNRKKLMDLPAVRELTNLIKQMNTTGRNSERIV